MNVGGVGESGDAVGQLGMLTGDARSAEGSSTGVRDCQANAIRLLLEECVITL